ncbi:NUDIX hydrolase [Oceanobacillus neutriphilus]|uniref:DNA mismatch repair protein MutT n=1 Tax=Oceanobacillus neutriphilus TaxID=531815 RepID=A0ABQ2NXW7_9BACI|nr:NUDIX hydrolase [Oceanobacillus neutriphilus]GGP13279.1 DNA mismatch repair protein MutT [Oceanobacillus neutriphilus]
MERVDVVYALILDENEEKILMVKNIKHDDWTMPGGAVEKGEILSEAVVREAKEETGLTIEAGDILSVNEAFMEKNDHHAIFFTFQAKVVSGEILIQDTETIADTAWVSIEEADKRMPYHKVGIRSLLEKAVPYVFQGRMS